MASTTIPGIFTSPGSLSLKHSTWNAALVPEWRVYYLQFPHHLTALSKARTDDEVVNARKNLLNELDNVDRFYLLTCSRILNVLKGVSSQLPAIEHSATFTPRVREHKSDSRAATEPSSSPIMLSMPSSSTGPHGLSVVKSGSNHRGQSDVAQNLHGRFTALFTPELSPAVPIAGEIDDIMLMPFDLAGGGDGDGVGDGDEDGHTERQDGVACSPANSPTAMSQMLTSHSPLTHADGDTGVHADAGSVRSGSDSADCSRWCSESLHADDLEEAAEPAWRRARSQTVDLSIRSDHACVLVSTPCESEAGVTELLNGAVPTPKSRRKDVTQSPMHRLQPRLTEPSLAPYLREIHLGVATPTNHTMDDIGALRINVDAQRTSARCRRSSRKCPEDIISFIRSKKVLDDSEMQMQLLSRFVTLNKDIYNDLIRRFPFALEGLSAGGRAFWSADKLDSLRTMYAELRDRVALMEPHEKAWQRSKVYTIGCFDLMHHGHTNLLRAMRDFGKTVIVGIHDDESILKLKGRLPVQPLSERIACIKPFTDHIFIIRDTDPTPAIKHSVSQSDIDQARCIYVRGDDMPDFPAREWVESVMQVMLLPRTENVSSSLVRMVYHGGDHNAALQAAFADCDELGRPVLSS